MLARNIIIWQLEINLNIGHLKYHFRSNKATQENRNMESTSTPFKHSSTKNISTEILAKAQGFSYWLVEVYSELQGYFLYGDKILDKN